MSMQQDHKDSTCPGCGGSLKEVYAEANYGRYLLLDQCKDCGGIWFDRWELYFLKDNEACRLDPVDSERLSTLLPFKKGPGLCPRCEIDLEGFQDPNLPEDTRIERCPRCNGLWLKRGELKRYANHKKAFGKTQTASPSLNQEDRQKRLETLQGLGKALSTRVTPEINLDEPEMGGTELKKDLVFLILQVLLRLILKI